jgi:DNA-binding NarL/FixJ family response regulator
MPKKSLEPATDKAKVLIVDDHPVVREGLAMHLATQPDLELCGEAEDLPGALTQLASSRPDVAIIDISLKNSNGIELIRRIKERDDAVRILVWSMYPENLYAERALRAGAQGYLSKGQATHHVLDAIRAILQGQVYVSGELANRFLQRAVGRKHEERSAIDSLSDRELEAFQLIGEGMTKESIAERMHVSPKTVETFRARIKEKLGIGNHTELIQRAAQWVVQSKNQRE